MIMGSTVTRLLNLFPPLDILLWTLDAKFVHQVADGCAVVAVELQLINQVDDVATAAGSKVVPAVTGMVLYILLDEVTEL